MAMRRFVNWGVVQSTPAGRIRALEAKDTATPAGAYRPEALIL
jgi:hypothetical protein